MMSDDDCKKLDKQIEKLKKENEIKRFRRYGT